MRRRRISFGDATHSKGKTVSCIMHIYFIPNSHHAQEGSFTNYQLMVEVGHSYAENAVRLNVTHFNVPLEILYEKCTCIS